MSDDSEQIPGDTRLYRRLHPTQIVYDDNEGVVRASSGAFRDKRLSVNLGNELDRIGESPAFALRNYPQHSLGWFSVEFARDEEGQEIESTPTPDDPTHGEVVGNKSGARRDRFAKKTELCILRQEFLRPDVRNRLPKD